MTGRKIICYWKVNCLAGESKKESESQYLALKTQVDKAISLSSYCVVDLSDVFKKLQVKKTAIKQAKKN